ncbi:hypothetical protein [Desulfofundulus thermocisternus]|uniref:hypothetical protein n=1 Tax=Desulfofundulus thermocisternus TaxID=42471 RepID=UPI00217CCE58|nr:hypothetical protein [Desulfofundulus thermocisternus]MCS5696984.1 hypothetical protein [Desulfofundulus thermocisternus]
MGRPEELTARDNELLEALAKCSVMTTKQIELIYGVKAYHYKRLKVLESRGLIKRDGRFILITSRGRNQMGVGRVHERLTDEQKREAAMIAWVYTKLNGWRIMNSQEAKRYYNLNRGDKIDGVIERPDGTMYAFYVLSTRPREATIKRITTELKNLWVVNIRRAIIFCPASAAMKAFGKDPCKLDELLVLPHPGGLDIFKAISKPGFIREVHDQAFPGRPYVPTEKPFADYQTEINGEQVYVSVLIGNDLVKRDHLTSYLNLGQRDKRVAIICLREQQKMFQKLFPEAAFYPVCLGGNAGESRTQ